MAACQTDTHRAIRRRTLIEDLSTENEAFDGGRLTTSGLNGLFRSIFESIWFPVTTGCRPEHVPMHQ
jgi:hypothetical protein